MPRKRSTPALCPRVDTTILARPEWLQEQPRAGYDKRLEDRRQCRNNRPSRGAKSTPGPQTAIRRVGEAKRNPPNLPRGRPRWWVPLRFTHPTIDSRSHPSCELAAHERPPVPASAPRLRFCCARSLPDIRGTYREIAANSACLQKSFDLLSRYVDDDSSAAWFRSRGRAGKARHQHGWHRRNVQWTSDGARSGS